MKAQFPPARSLRISPVHRSATALHRFVIWMQPIMISELPSQTFAVSNGSMIDLFAADAHASPLRTRASRRCC
jgi:hypothetical protein